jgi:tetratricopeptide (TPR) repeat protein
MVQGNVRVAGGALPNQAIEVRLELHGQLVDRAYTDGRGYFVFSGLGAHTYTLVVKADGYVPIHEPLTIHSTGGGNLQVNLTLQPSSSPGAAGETSPTISLTDLLAELPPNARSEFEAGAKAAEKGKSGEAIEHYRKAIELAPEFYPAHSQLGYQYMNSGDLKKAEEQFRKAFQLKDTEAPAYFGLGNVLLQTERYAEAEKTLRAGLEREPRSAFGNYLLGAVFFRTGKLVDSEKSLRTALELDPNLALAQMSLVDLYLQQQRDREALVELKTFVEKFPKHPMLPKAKQLLSQLEAWLRSQPPR